jgi:tRNA (mo5U34)-methyltransferase
MSFTDEQIRAMVGAVRVWYHIIPLGPGIVTPGINDPRMTLCHLDLPNDCRGMRALDIGSRDGFFAFELERRGADVIAVDYVPCEETGFKTVADILGSKVTFRQDNIYNLSPERIGKFDIVLFLGLLYHLPDPIQAINLVRALCTGRMCLETHAIDNGVMLPDGTTAPLTTLSPALAEIPLMRFYPGRTLAGDPTNYWGPNYKCLEGMLQECRFKVLSHTLSSDRAIVNCDVVDDTEKEYLLKLARGLRPKA